MTIQTPAGKSSVQVVVPEQAWADAQDQLRQAREEAQRLRTILELQADLNEAGRFMSLAMALCNNIAARWQARRVSLGLLKGRHVRIVAMSHTEKILPKMRLVQDIETAMEECLDQDLEVVYPPIDEMPCVTRAAEALSKTHGPHTICSLPLRQTAILEGDSTRAAGEVRGVVTLEFAPERKIAMYDLETFRLALELCAGRLLDLYEHDRWFGARILASCRRYPGKLLGPQHTWIKLAAVAGCAGLAWLVLARGEFHISAPVTLQPVRQAEVVAPFDGYIKKVLVRPGDKVLAHVSILAMLHTARLRDKLATAEAQLATCRRQADIARAKDKFADMRIAQEGMVGAAAQIRLLQMDIHLAALRSPISGVVLTGKLQRRIGAPVKLGDVLFRVAPIQPLLARIRVSDEDILYVQRGQTGQLATNAYPQHTIDLRVVRIDPLAAVHRHRNAFSVRATIQHAPPWLRPGMEGTAHIRIGRRHYIWMWTRPLVNWLRMKLWF